MEVGEDRDGDAAERPRPRDVTRLRIDRECHDLDSCIQEGLSPRVQRGYLLRSSRCPVEWIEEQQDGVPAVVPQVKAVPVLVEEREVRGGRSDRDHAAP